MRTKKPLYIGGFLQYTKCLELNNVSYSNTADSIPWPTTPRFAVVTFVIGTKKIPGLANIKGIHCIHRLIDQCRYTIAW